MAFNISELKLEGGTQIDRRIIKKLFGGIQLCPLMDEDGKPDEIELTIHQILPNFYRASNANMRDNPLYIVVPNTQISNVWPIDIRLYDDIRFGTVTVQKEVVTQGVVFHKGTTGLYICTNPTASQFQHRMGYLGI